MKRVLITGATGFVGANLARRLLQDGHEVHVFVRPRYKTWRIEAIRKDARIYEVDFLDKDNLREVIAGVRPEWVFHLAAYGAYSWQDDLARMVQTNITGTINLLEACIDSGGFEAFVNTGSSSEYGFKDHAVSETEKIEPNSHYAITKATATMYCHYAAGNYKLPITTLRLYSVYGPYEDPARLVPTLVLEGISNRLPPLVNPDIGRDFIFIDDVLEAYILAATHPPLYGAIYNVGSGIQTTVFQAVELARRVLGITAQPQWGQMPDRSWDTKIWLADNRLIIKELGWQAAHTFEDGFRKMAHWVIENKDFLLSVKEQHSLK